MTGIFDTHAHYDDKAFDEDREAILASLPENNVLRVVNIGAGLASSRRTLALADRYDYVYGAVGVHPGETGELQENPAEAAEELAAMCRHKKCVAVGEIGLDYYWDEPDREIQKKWFVQQLHLAKKCNLPVVIHSRDAAKDTADLMKAEKAGETGGVIHCFSYTKEMAGIFLDMGCFIGVGGVLTFGNARKLKEAVQYLPMDRIVLETDCPYLAPVPYRGKRNSSLYLPYVVTTLAALKGITEEEVRRAVWDNSIRLYRMKEPETKTEK